MNKQLKNKIGDFLTTISIFGIIWMVTLLTMPTTNKKPINKQLINDGTMAALKENNRKLEKMARAIHILITVLLAWLALALWAVWYAQKVHVIYYLGRAIGGC